jgi:hypothetical protein
MVNNGISLCSTAGSGFLVENATSANDIWIQISTKILSVIMKTNKISPVQFLQFTKK